MEQKTIVCFCSHCLEKRRQIERAYLLNTKINLAKVRQQTTIWRLRAYLLNIKIRYRHYPLALRGRQGVLFWSRMINLNFCFALRTTQESHVVKILQVFAVGITAPNQFSFTVPTVHFFFSQCSTKVCNSLILALALAICSSIRLGPSF